MLQKKYRHVSPSAFPLTGKHPIAVIRASGAISGQGGSGSDSGITSKAFIRELRRARENKKIKAVVLRVDSPGGDALASDLMWREIRQCAAKKPVRPRMHASRWGLSPLRPRPPGA